MWNRGTKHNFFISKNPFYIPVYTVSSCIINLCRRNNATHYTWPTKLIFHDGCSNSRIITLARLGLYLTIDNMYPRFLTAFLTVNASVMTNFYILFHVKLDSSNDSFVYYFSHTNYNGTSIFQTWFWAPTILRKYIHPNTMNNESLSEHSFQNTKQLVVSSNFSDPSDNGRNNIHCTLRGKGN